SKGRRLMKRPGNLTMRGFSISALLFTILCSAPLARAQSASGEIAGSVLDESGATIPKALVAVLSRDTGLERRFETDSLGNYIFTQLSPGNYSIRVEKAGFQRSVREGITLQVGQRARIEVTLRVGAVTENVSINAQAGLLDVDEASLGQVIENR